MLTIPNATTTICDKNDKIQSNASNDHLHQPLLLLLLEFLLFAKGLDVAGKCLLCEESSNDSLNFDSRYYSLFQIFSNSSTLMSRRRLSFMHIASNRRTHRNLLSSPARLDFYGARSLFRAELNFTIHLISFLILYEHFSLWQPINVDITRATNRSKIKFVSSKRNLTGTLKMGNLGRLGVKLPFRRFGPSIGRWQRTSSAFASPNRSSIVEAIER